MYILNPQEASQVCEKYARKMNLGKNDYFKKCIDEPIAIKLCVENLNYINRLFKINVNSIWEFEELSKHKLKGIYKNVKAPQKKRLWKNYILNLYFFHNDIGVPRLFKYENKILSYKEYLKNYNNEKYDLRISEYNIIRDVLF